MSVTFHGDELAAWSGGTWSETPPATVAGVSKDTRDIAPGQLYIALKGDRFDGHAFVQSAREAGAGAAMVDAEWSGRAPDGFPLLRVDGTTAALGRLGAGYRRHLGVRVLGITGSAGKSTVKEMAAAVLGQAFRTARTHGNWNNEIGLPMSLLAMAPDTEWGVFELGMNQPGEIAALTEILGPDMGMVTAIGEAHIEPFGSVDAIAAEKGAMLTGLPADGVAILDRDGQYFEQLAALCPGRIITISMQGEADLEGTARDPESGDLSVTERSSGESWQVACPWPGMHQARNALMAVAAGRACGMSVEAVGEGLATYTPMPMRWAREVRDGVVFINDAYNANPLSMRAATAAFADVLCTGEHWLVLGDMLELGDAAEAAHDALGRELARGRWAGLVTVGPLARRIATGARGAGFAGAIHSCDDTAAAAGVLRDVLEPGDAVLLKGSRGVALERVLDGFIGPVGVT